ncbi:subtilisin-like protein [Piromyces finnis]|uniref:Subtilisin-like protein n=1 Tax=Piromyces finnis TaxID=1754191 RepID=A0A1Y1VCC7_9FUNG|nr:subtilisin-like protein [Piromyces finnis]|eukprot:ORX52623.1 subtilisin-like protein [Piromyces finnis]
MHLSLISQGIVNHDIIGSFDYNYYYPSSAGEDIDIILIDTGFNFENEEFSNHGKERQVRCVAEIQNAILSESLEESRCGLHREASYHGEIVADIVGGLESGVANKANIYGIAVHSKEGKFLEEDMFLALQYIIDTLIRPHKTVINLSSGIYYPISEPGDNYHHYQLLIRRLVEKGATVIASAGNDGALTYNRKHNFQYCPCSFYGVICVGGIKDIHPIFSNHYEVDAYSNSGETVNIYAPFYVYGSYQDEKGRDHDDYFYGTSFSAPIVAGVAATIMGEFKAIKFDSYSMNDFLIRLGEKNRITNLDPGRNNVFLNNGKSMVYSSDGMYYGCGYHSGHHTCSNPKSTCSEEGYCINENGEIELEKSNPIIKDDFPDFDFDFDFPFLSYYSTTDDQATEFPEWYDESDEKNEERITTDPFFFEPEDEEEIFNENDKTFSVTLIDDPLLIPEPTDDINEGIGLD